MNPSLQAAAVGQRGQAAGEALPVSVRDIDGVGAMNALADYGSSSDDDDGSGDEAMPPAPAPAPAPAAALPSAAALLNGPARPATEAALPSAAALLNGPARPPTEDVRPRLGPARPPADNRPAKRKRSGVSGGLMAPPQMRRPNVSTEAVGSWSSKATTKKFQSKEREKLSRR